MRLDPRWIVLDLAGPDDGDLMVHSIGGVPCERTLRRAIKVCDLQLEGKSPGVVGFGGRGLG